METATGIASKAADQFFAQGILGTICVILALVIVGIVVFSVREIQRLNGELLKAERSFRADYSALQNTVTASLASLQQAMALISSMGGKK